MTTQPTFEHPIFDQLYQRDYFIDDAILREILALESQAAVPELLKITEATLTDFDYDNPDLDWFESHHFLHALYLLNEFKASEALGVLRRFLHLSGEVQEFWFGDGIFEDLPVLLATAGQSRLTELIALVEDGTYTLQSRLAVSNALLRLARLHPATRPDISAFFGRYLSTIIDHSQQAQLLFPADEGEYGYGLDTYLGLLLAEMQDANLRELEPEIRELHRLKLVDESITGTEAQIEFDRGRPLPPADDIFARYQKLREEPDSYSPYHPDAAAIAERRAEAEAKRQQALAEYYQRGTPQLPHQVAHKIGRNDPLLLWQRQKVQEVLPGVAAFGAVSFFSDEQLVAPKRMPV